MSQYNWFSQTQWGKKFHKWTFKYGTPVNWNAFQVTTSCSWLRECQECAKLSSRQRVATLKNLTYKIYLDLFNTFLVTTWFLMSSLLFYNVKINKNPGMSRCPQTFDWYCMCCSTARSTLLKGVDADDPPWRTWCHNQSSSELNIFSQEPQTERKRERETGTRDTNLLPVYRYCGYCSSPPPSLSRHRCHRPLMEMCAWKHRGLPKS